MVNPAHLETLASYVPALIVRRLAGDLRPIPLPTAEEVTGTVLFADISGFTALTESLAEWGPAGAEELTRLLNNYFGQIIEIVAGHGGDVVKFAGDALLALWHVDLPSEDLAAATRRVAQCALEVQEAVRHYHSEEGLLLSLRIGIGAGQVRTIHLGGVFGRCEFAVTGQPFVDVGLASKHAQPGDVVLTPTAWELVRESCTGEFVDDGSATRLRAVHQPLPPRPLQMPPLRDEMEGPIRAYIPAAIRARLDAGQTSWLGELRPVTVLFMNLPDMNYLTPLQLAQTVMCELQNTLYRYEGSINKLSVDDKGVTLVAALGLPPLAHEDDAVRGVEAGMAMHAKLRGLGWSSNIGITTGRVFCGAYGSARRREYTMIGDVVNLSARLMQASQDGILCDEATYRAAQAREQFESLPAIMVKGKAEPVTVFRPQGRGSRVLKSATAHPLVGRQSERQVLLDRLHRLAREKEGGVVMVEGEPGIGKSRLLAELHQPGAQEGMRLLLGAGDRIEQTTPYHAWRPVFRQLLRLEEVGGGHEAWRRQVMAQLQATPDLMPLAPLVSAVLGVDWPGNDLTAQMTGEVRAANINRVLVKLVQQAARAAPLLVLMEDCYWLDSASWALARQLAREVQPLLLVLAIRPLTDPVPPDYTQLWQLPHTHCLRLDALPLEQAVALVCHRLGVRTVPEELAALVREKAQGHPLFCEQLALALREEGLIKTTDGQCQLTIPPEVLRSFNFPDTVQGLVTSRIDRLTPAQQLTLKVASVIGRVFALHVLREVYPLPEDRDTLAEILHTLERLDLIKVEGRSTSLTCTFKHNLTQEVVYNLMLVSQRRELHRTVGEWYERAHADDLAPFYPTLAYHWGKTEVDAKALDYLEKAGEQALLSHANGEAVRFFTKALERHEPGSPLADSLRRARWERQLGEAHYALGNPSSSLEHLEKALALLEIPVPGSDSKLVLGTVGEVCRQLVHRTWPGHRWGRAKLPIPRLLEAARAYERLAQLQYMNDAQVRCFHAAFCSLNLAELVGPSPELARTFANVSVAFGLLSLHSIAEAHTRRAWQIAEQVNQLPCTTYVLEVTGIYWFSTGQWDKARKALDRAVETAARIGDLRRWDEAMLALVLIHYSRGDFTRSAAAAHELYTAAVRRGIVQVQSWGLSLRLINLLTRDLKEARVNSEVDEVLCLMEALIARHQQGAHELVRADQVLVLGLLALARWRRGERHLALKTANLATEVALLGEPTSHYVHAGYVGLAEVYLGIWEAERTPGGGEPEVAARARTIIKALWSFARMHPIGRPRAWLYQGLHDWLAGRPAHAQRAWRKGLTAATKLAMPYDEALAHIEIAQHTKEETPGQKRHLSRAGEILGRLGTGFHLHSTKQTLRWSR